MKDNIGVPSTSNKISLKIGTVSKHVKKRSWKKPKGKPKRPLSAYNIFFHDQRIKILLESPPLISDVNSRKRRRCRKTHGKIGFADLARKIAESWKILDKASKGPYEIRAREEKKRYAKELEVWKKAQEAKKKSLDFLAPADSNILMDEDNKSICAFSPEIESTSDGYESNVKNSTVFVDHDGVSNIKTEAIEPKFHIPKIQESPLTIHSLPKSRNLCIAKIRPSEVKEFDEKCDNIEPLDLLDTEKKESEPTPCLSPSEISDFCALLYESLSKECVDETFDAPNSLGAYSTFLLNPSSPDAILSPAFDPIPSFPSDEQATALGRLNCELSPTSDSQGNDIEADLDSEFLKFLSGNDCHNDDTQFK